jgi:hypothetical protein
MVACEILWPAFVFRVVWPDLDGHAIAGAIGPVIVGKAFDATGSYRALLIQLAALTAGSAALLLFMPRYNDARTYSEPPLDASAPDVALLL